MVDDKAVINSMAAGSLPNQSAALQPVVADYMQSVSSKRPAAAGAANPPPALRRKSNDGAQFAGVGIR